MRSRLLTAFMALLAAVAVALTGVTVWLYTDLQSVRDEAAALQADLRTTQAERNHLEAEVRRAAELQEQLAAVRAELEEQEAQLAARDRELEDAQADIALREAYIEELEAELEEIYDSLDTAAVTPVCRLPDEATVRVATTDMFRATVARDPSSEELDMLTEEFMDLVRQECAAHERGEAFDVGARYQMVLDEHLAPEVALRGRQEETARQRELMQSSLCVMDRMVRGEQTDAC